MTGEQGLTNGYLINSTRLEITMPAANQKLKTTGETCREHSMHTSNTQRIVADQAYNHFARPVQADRV